MSFKKIDRENNERKEGRNCVLIYGYDKPELELIELCREKSGIDEIVIISESEVEFPLEVLLDKEAFSSDSVQYSEVYSLACTIIFSGTSHQELDRFIEASKTITITRPIFAGTTADNLKWTFKALVEELVQEREEMKKMREASKK